MGSVIDFQKTSNGLLRGEDCRTPVEVERASLNSIIVRFRVDLFDPERLDFALRNVFRCQDYWGMTKFPGILEEKPDPRLVSYLIYVTKMPSMKVEDTLRQALYLVTQAVYVEEIRLRRPKAISIEEIVDCDQVLKINPRTLKLLYRAGVCSMYDMVSKTREDLAEIPGMTTEEIFNLEKVLASRGWSLVASRIPAWE